MISFFHNNCFDAIHFLYIQKYANVVSKIQFTVKSDTNFNVPQAQKNLEMGDCITSNKYKIGLKHVFNFLLNFLLTCVTLKIRGVASTHSFRNQL
jgi:hypothetical protein